MHRVSYSGLQGSNNIDNVHCAFHSTNAYWIAPSHLTDTAVYIKNGTSTPMWVNGHQTPPPRPPRPPALPSPSPSSPPRSPAPPSDHAFVQHPLYPVTVTWFIYQFNNVILTGCPYGSYVITDEALCTTSIDYTPASTRGPFMDLGDSTPPYCAFNSNGVMAYNRNNASNYATSPSISDHSYVSLCRFDPPSPSSPPASRHRHRSFATQMSRVNHRVGQGPGTPYWSALAKISEGSSSALQRMVTINAAM